MMTFKNRIYICVILVVLLILGVFGSFTFFPKNNSERTERKPAEAKAASPSHFWSWFASIDESSVSSTTSPKPARPILSAINQGTPATINQAATVIANQSLQKRSASDAALMNSSPSGKLPDFLGGQEAQAAVKVDGQNYQLEPNQGGDFGRIVMGAKSTASVQISYPQANPTDPVVIEAEDGGVLGSGSVTQAGQLDNSREIAFNFESGTEDGIYRVTLRQGPDIKQIDFWVGPELPVAR